MLDWLTVTLLAAGLWGVIRAYRRGSAPTAIGGAVALSVALSAWILGAHVSWVLWWFDFTPFVSRAQEGAGWREDPWLVDLHRFGALLTFFAYVAIPIELIVYYARRKRAKADVPTSAAYMTRLFCAFIFICGVGNLLGYMMFERPMYRVDGLVRLLNGCVSIATAGVLPFLLQQLIQLPSLHELDEAQREARQNVIPFEKVMQESGIGVAVLSADPAHLGRFVRVNRVMEGVFGMPSTTICEKTLTDLAHPDDREEASRLLNRLRDGEITRSRYPIRFAPDRSSDLLIHALLSLSIVRDVQTADPLYFIAQVVDVSAEVDHTRRIEAQAALIERHRDQLVSELEDLKSARNRAHDEGMERSVATLDAAIERLTRMAEEEDSDV